MSEVMGGLREETVEESMSLQDIREFWGFVVQQPDHGLEELMIGLSQTLPQLKHLDNLSEYQEASVIHVLAKIMHEYGALPNTIQMGAFLKDVCLPNEAAEKLLEWNHDTIINLYSLLQDDPRRSRKRSKANATGTICTSSWAVRWVALLTKMACQLVAASSVEWSIVETTVRKWIAGTLHRTQVTSGLALAALDILDSAKSSPPTVGSTQVLGLTPRRVYSILQVPSVIDLFLVNAAYPVPRMALVAQFADILLTYANNFIEEEEAIGDAVRVCDALIRSAFSNTVAFLLDDLTKKAGDPPDATTRKRKRLESGLDPSSRTAQVLVPSYPFLVRIRVKLANDNRVDARNVASLMERSKSISEHDKICAWGYIMDHVRHTGDVFLDGNDIQTQAYIDKRNKLLDLRRFMGNVGFDAMVDWYKLLMEEANKDRLISVEEKHYITLASQQTVLKLLIDKFGERRGVQRMQEEFPSVSNNVWGQGNLMQWAWNFGTKPNPIPESLLENGQLDLRSMWNRASGQETAEEVAQEEAAVPVQEPQQADVESFKQDEVVVEQENVEEIGVREQAIEEILSSEEEQEEQPQVEEILSSEEEEQSEEIYDSSDDGMQEPGYVDGLQEYRREEAIELLDSSSEEQEQEEEEEEIESDAEQDALRLEPVREAIDDYEEDDISEEAQYEGFVEGAYDSQEEIVGDDHDVVNVDSSEEEGASDSDVSAGGSESEGEDGEPAVTVHAQAEMPVEQQVQIDKGYEPDTTGQTEEEDEDDRKMKEPPKKSPRLVRGLLASRGTLSDMDAADERTEPSDVEDQLTKEHPTSPTSRTMESEASSSLFAYAQKDSPAKKEAMQAKLSPTVKKSDARPNNFLKEEPMSMKIVSQVPKIDDVRPDEEGTNDTVAGRSEAFSDARTEEMAQVERNDVPTEHVVDHVPVVEDAKAGDDTSAAFAASETGQYLSEAYTEDIRQPEEPTETIAQDKPALVARNAEKKPAKKVAGSETDVGYMGDIEEKPSSTANAAATTAAFSMQAPGYEADVEERSVLPGEESHPKRSDENSVPGFSAPGKSRPSFVLEVYEAPISKEAGMNDRVEEAEEKSPSSPPRKKEQSEDKGQLEEAVIENKPRSVEKLRSSPGQGRNDEQTPSTPPRTRRRSISAIGSPASHTRSHDVPSVGSPAAHARSHDSKVEAESSIGSEDEGDTAKESAAVHDAAPSTPLRTRRRSISAIGSPASHTRSHDMTSVGSPAAHTRSLVSKVEAESAGTAKRTRAAKRTLSPEKRGIGRRPRKKQTPESAIKSPSTTKKKSPGRPRKTAFSTKKASPPPKKPGRPRKSPLPEDITSTTSPSPKKSRPAQSRKKVKNDSETAEETSFASGATRRSARLRGAAGDQAPHLGSPEAHTRSHTSEVSAESPPKKKGGRLSKKQQEEEGESNATESPPKRARRGRPSMQQQDEEGEAKAVVESSPPKKGRGRPANEQQEEGELNAAKESPPKRARRGRPQKQQQGEEGEAEAIVESSPPKKRRGRPAKEKGESNAAKESPPKRAPRGRPLKQQQEEEGEAEAIVESSPPKKRRGRPTKNKQEDSSSIKSTATQQIAHGKKAASSDSSPIRRSKRIRQAGTDSESDGDDVESQASTKKSGAASGKGKGRSKRVEKRAALGSIPEDLSLSQQEDASVSSMDSSSVVSKRTARRSAASRDSLSTIPESPGVEKNSRKKTATQSSAASSASASTRATRSSARLRSKRK